MGLLCQLNDFLVTWLNEKLGTGEKIQKTQVPATKPDDLT